MTTASALKPAATDTRAEVLSRAEAWYPQLRDRAAEGDTLRTMPPDLASGLKATGLFRLALPASLGGWEADPFTIFEVIERICADLSEPDAPWVVRPVGALDLLPDSTSRALKEAQAATAGKSGLTVNVAVGYGGRREITDAVRSLLTAAAERGASLQEVAATLDMDVIAEHLYTSGQPDPDLVIRTSGEQRLGGFLLWQSAQSEFYFCEAYWPDFRKVDFLRAIRAYAQRERRYGRV